MRGEGLFNMKILKMTIVRTLLLVPTLFGLITIMFFLTYYIPADPVGVAAGPNATPEQVEIIRARYGFDQPIHVQYWKYIRNIIKGDLGRSLYSQRDILTDIKERLPATIEISLIALVFGSLTGVALGVFSAIYRNSLVDYFIRIVTIAAISIAGFWIAIQLQLTFSSSLGLLPLIGRISRNLRPPNTVTGFYLIDSLIARDFRLFYDSLIHMVLPVISLALVPIGTVARFVRAGILGVLESTFVLYAKSMGLSQRLLLWKYILKNALVSAVAQIGLVFGYILATTFVVEKIFMWPGIGSYALDSILYLDYKAVFAVSIWAGIAYAVGGLLADILSDIVDPREVSK